MKHRKSLITMNKYRKFNFTPVKETLLNSEATKIIKKYSIKVFTSHNHKNCVRLTPTLIDILFKGV